MNWITFALYHVIWISDVLRIFNWNLIIASIEFKVSYTSVGKNWSTSVVSFVKVWLIESKEITSSEK